MYKIILLCILKFEKQYLLYIINNTQNIQYKNNLYTTFKIQYKRNSIYDIKNILSYIIKHNAIYKNYYVQKYIIHYIC